MKIVKEKEVGRKKNIVVFDDQDPMNDVLMTHLHGEMVISFQKIVDILGQPNGSHDSYKSSAQWQIVTPFGMGTIYDYKEGKSYLGRAEGKARKDIVNWHIGAHNKATADCIIKLFFK